MMASPLEIQIAIFYWTRPEGDYGLDNGDCNFNAPAVRETFQAFVKAGLLFKNTSGPRNYEGNPAALEPYIMALCQVPFPVQRWVVERDA